MPTSPSDAVDPNIVSKSEFARMNDWGKSYVSNLGAQGRLVLTDDGKVKVKESLALIAATTGAPERASPPAVQPQFRADRDRKEFYDAENARLDLEARTGKLLVRADVLSAVSDVAVRLRAQLEAWPARLTPQLAALGGNEARIHALLADQVQLALTDMSMRIARLERLQVGEGAGR